MRCFAATSLAVALSFVAVAARADAPPRLVADWGRLFEQGSRWLQANSQVDRESQRGATNEMRSAPEPLQAPVPMQLGTGWFGVEPNVAIVARDWGDAVRLTGRLSAMDQFRLSRSSRMVITRVRLGEGRVVPFAQLGLGQWRVDTDLLPGWARDTEVAAQFGGGAEVQVSGAWALALECDYTVLYRETREPQNIASPRFISGLVATRVRF